MKPRYIVLAAMFLNVVMAITLSIDHWLIATNFLLSVFAIWILSEEEGER